ncbi:uncharacterized protein LTR77_005859 [Saxophila tyrrhenica]|uniref:F-box domain-containing protein n=1 Tax=Saxophila tyrrhenica TaxID=1690608 RepID=A0AAV9PBX5_9PEZI|nr:hypothetical protein LTR77_005859 [Saxophila tyrrhenica]
MATAASTAVFDTFELVQAIVEFLPTADIVACQPVCHTFNTVIKDTRSNIIKQKLFLAPISKTLLDAKTWTSVTGILPSLTSVDLERETPGDSIRLVLNPRIHALNVVIDKRGFVRFNFLVDGLFDILKPDHNLASAYLCQPPATVAIDMIRSVALHGRLALPMFEVPGVLPESHMMTAGKTINSLRETLENLRQKIPAAIRLHYVHLVMPRGY